MVGETPYEMMLQGVGAKDDPASGGRQMPSHWGNPKFHLVTGSSPTGTRWLHAVGAAEASLYYQEFPKALEQARKAPGGEFVGSIATKWSTFLGAKAPPAKASFSRR